jgi:hypothetical protein
MKPTRAYRGTIEERLLAEVDKLPDAALVRLLPASGGVIYGAISLPQPEYVSDPDFARGYKRDEQAIKYTADFIRADLRGHGKYAPHFSNYDVEYRLLPHWCARAAAASKEA